MKTTKTYLKGGAIFLVSLIVILVTTLTVYFTGIHSHRSITYNFYISLGIIGFLLFGLLFFGLYRGVSVLNTFPKFKMFKRGSILPEAPIDVIESIGLEVGDGLKGILFSILAWIAMTILLFIGLLLLEIVLWFSFFILLTMLYWGFFRALRLVFSKSHKTVGKIAASLLYALSYTILYLGWIFIIVFLADYLR